MKNPLASKTTMAFQEFPSREKEFRDYLENGKISNMVTRQVKKGFMGSIFLAATFLAIGYFENTLIFFDSFTLFSVSAIIAAAIVFGTLVSPLMNFTAALAIYAFLRPSENLSFEEILAAVVYGRLFSTAPGTHVILSNQTPVGNTKAIIAVATGILGIIVLLAVPATLLIT